MNILMVKPEWEYSEEDRIIPPLGMAYVSASLKSNGFNVYILNMSINKEGVSLLEAMEKSVKENNIEIVCCGGLVVNYHKIKQVCDYAKQINPSIITMIGGGLVTSSPKEAMMGITTADYGVIGEGEITNCELVTAIIEKADISKVDGIIFRTKDGLVITNKREEIKDIDSIPFPDYEGFNFFEMTDKFYDKFGTATLPIVSSRSCPFNCTFCSHSGGKKYRKRSLDNIFEEINFWFSKFKFSHITLYDELFADDINRITEFCERINKYSVTWQVALRVSKNITPELLRKMKESGCTLIYYGLESGDNSILKSMRKGTTKELAKHVLEITNEAAIKTNSAFIFGYIEETYESAMNTFDFIDEIYHLSSHLSLGCIILFPGSPLYEYAVKKGIITDTLKFIEDGCPLINISKMSDDEYWMLANEKIPSKLLEMSNSRTIKEEITFFSDKDNNLYELQFYCPHCGNEIRHTISPDFILAFATYFCNECNRDFDYSPMVSYINFIEDKLKIIINNNKVAIWGLIREMKIAYQESKCLREDNYILIDISIEKQKMGYSGRKVYPPSEILNSDIDTVIIMPTGRFRENIKEEIKRNYPTVKNIIWFFEIGLM